VHCRKPSKSKQRLDKTAADKYGQETVERLLEEALIWSS
jgi:hypothetical protein